MKILRCVKRCMPYVALCLLFVFLSSRLTNVLTPKSENRYYILEKYLEEHPEDNLHDVQVFGSCHSYTSFNPVYLKERTGISAFVYGNAGEIIPTTYARMTDQFNEHVPKVALVEIWGINPYETYATHNSVFGYYIANNLERTEFTLAKQEVISDFDDISFEGDDKVYDEVSFLKMNYPLVNYKDRLLDGSLTDVDFDYTFDEMKNYSSDYVSNEMTSRLTLNGFKKNPSSPLPDYPKKQNYIKGGEFLGIEPDIVKYIQKIIDLCKKNGVELIFYRSPYLSTVNELRKLNHMRKICEENDVQFIDLEAELQYDYYTDFLDYQHLSEIGANRSTEFLIPYILDALENSGISNIYTGDMLPGDILEEGDFLGEIMPSDEQNVPDVPAFTVGGWYLGAEDTLQLTTDGLKDTCQKARKGWSFHQVVEGANVYVGKSLTAVFDISHYKGKNMWPTISCWNENDEEICRAQADLESGRIVFSCAIPEGTEYMRVGFYRYDGTTQGNSVTVNSIHLYEGAYTLETLPEA